MSEYIVQCPYCSTSLMLQSEFIGSNVECSHCGNKFKTAKPKENANSVNKVSRAVELSSNNNSSAETFNFICPECNTIAKLPISMQGNIYQCNACCEKSIAEPSAERFCPYCNGAIKLNATVCKHCKQIISPAVNPANVGGQRAFSANSNIYGTQGQAPYYSTQFSPLNNQPNTNYGTNITVIQENGNRNACSPSYPVNQNVTGAKSRATYIVLAWFLGNFGVHNFYAGYRARAMQQLLLTLFGIIFSFILVIIAEAMDEPDQFLLFLCLIPLGTAITVFVEIIVDIFCKKEDADGIPFC